MPEFLNVSYWERSLPLVYSADIARKILCQLLEGVRIGRDPAAATVISPNWPSVATFASQVEEVIVNDLAGGRLLGPFTAPPFDHFISSPLGAFTKRNSTKIRLIHDLSYPSVGSVNAEIDPEQFSLHYATIDDAAAYCVEFDVPFLAKLDLKDAYKHVAVSPLDWHLLGFQWGESEGQPQFYFSKVLNFGLRSAPALFDIFASTLSLFMFREGVSARICRYVDDFLVVAPSRSVCQQNLDVMLNTCHLAGFEVQPSKVTVPDQRVEFLGIVIDTRSWELSISPERVEEINTLLSSWQVRKSSSKRELLSLVGKLAFAAKVVRSGRAFLGRLISLAKKVKHLHGRVRISAAARKDLTWWATCLSAHNGVYMFRPDWDDSNVVHIFTDASNVGFGGVCQDSWFAIEYSGSLGSLVEQSINWRELHAATRALLTWGPPLKGRLIRFHVDNSAACGMLSRLYTPVTELMEFIRAWAMAIEVNDLKVSVVYISTHDNTAADQLSRAKVADFLAANPIAKHRVWPTPVDYFGVSL